MSNIHPTMRIAIDKFTEITRNAMAPADLPQVARPDPVAGLSYAVYFEMVEALRTALALIDNTGMDSAIDVRGQIERALVAAEQSQQVAA